MLLMHTGVLSNWPKAPHVRGPVLEHVAFGSAWNVQNCPWDRVRPTLQLAHFPPSMDCTVHLLVEAATGHELMAQDSSVVVPL